MKLLLKPLAIVLSLIPGLHAMEQKQDIFFFDNLPKENIKAMIMAKAAPYYYYEYGHAGELALVNKEWQQLINNSTLEHPLYKIPVSFEEYCIFNVFINGRLIYKPNKDDENDHGGDIQEKARRNNIGMKAMRISDLMNDSKGFDPFDLEECGVDTSSDLKISPGYRKERPDFEEGDLQIWIVSRPEIERELKNGKAQHLAEIFPKWKKNAPIGVFWTPVVDNEKARGFRVLYHYDYRTENFKSMSNDDLIEHKLGIYEHIIRFWAENSLAKKWQNGCESSCMGAGPWLKRKKHLFTKDIDKFSFCFKPTFQVPEVLIPESVEPVSEFQPVDEPFIDFDYAGLACVIS